MVKNNLVSLSTPGPTHHILLAVVGPPSEGVATYGPRNLLSCAILAALSALYVSARKWPVTRAIKQQRKCKGNIFVLLCYKE